MNSVGGVATERRLPQQTHQQFLSHSLVSSNATIIDESQFPSLGAKGTPPLGGGFSPIPTTSGSVLNVAQSSPSRDNYGAHRTNYANLMRADPSLTNSEFQIQNEDFPALPGVGGPGQTSRPMLGDQLTNVLSDDHNHHHHPHDFAGPLGDCDPSQLGGGLSRNSQEGPVHGIVTHPDGEVTNIPASMLDDQFGMAGLVTYLRTVDNPSIVSLALGYDLTTLGLNLNLSEYAREWRFHKSEQVWLTRSQYGGVKEQTGTYEKGHYNVFDQMQWRKIPKELKLEYNQLEDRPKLPANGQPTPYKYFFHGPQFPSGPETGLMIQMQNLALGVASGGGRITPPTTAATAAGLNGVMVGGGVGVGGGIVGGGSVGAAQQQQQQQQQQAARATPN
uniref:NOT2_3_5 domain-containing protein n=1 Tax=Caenorhabditis japonica TaxID=281687 RepID=A0A8R1DF10_CAEJA